MAHELEITTDGTASMAYSVDYGRPWHGLGTEVKGLMTSSEALAAAGLDWTVSKVPLYARFGSKYMKSPDRYAIQRSSDGAILGTVGKDYSEFQNTEAFGFLDTLLQSGEAHIDTAGSLFGGKRIWIAARLDDFTVLGQDVYEQWMLITNSHDGSRALQASITPIRVVCANTEAMALSHAQQTFRIRHRGDLSGKVQEAKETLQVAHKYTEEFVSFSEDLAKIQVSVDTFEAIMKANFPEQKRQLATNLQNVKIIRAESPRIPDDLRGTAYGALSALTEWTSWGKEYRTEEARMKSLLLGWSRDVVTNVAKDLLKV
jgi:phage/plasmid-like protein (TIGR03299 family)